MSDRLALTPSALRSALSAYEPRRWPAGPLRQAAVLVPIVLHDERPPELLFIVRPTTLASHSGQVAFPGGRIDPSDADARAAALREAHEELGLSPSAPEVIGSLDDMPSSSGYHVTPIVAFVRSPLDLAPSPDEVASVFQVPLARLADPAERRTMRGHFRPSLAQRGGEARLYFWVHTPAPIWGVTGHILMNLLKVLQAPG